MFTGLTLMYKFHFSPFESVRGEKKSHNPLKPKFARIWTICMLLHRHTANPKTMQQLHAQPISWFMTYK